MPSALCPEPSSCARPLLSRRCAAGSAGDLDAPDEVRPPRIGPQVTDTQARVGYDVTPRHALSLSYLDGSSDVDRSHYQDVLGPTAVMTKNSRSTLMNVGSRYVRERLLITNHVAWAHDTVNVGNRDRLMLSDGLYSEWTWRGDGHVVVGKRQALEFGGQLQRVLQEGSSNQLVYAPALTTVVDSFNTTARTAGAYVQDAVTLDRVRLTIGARRDAHTLSPTAVMTPYASVWFEPSLRTHVQFDWGRYAQFPELGQYSSTFAQNRLRPERSTHYELALEQRLDARTRVRVELYAHQDRNLLSRPGLEPRVLADGTVVQADPLAPILNSAHGRSRGLTVFLQRRTANGFTGWVSYTGGRTTISDAQMGLSFPSDDDQRHTINAYVSRRVRPTVNVSGRFTYGSGTPLPGFYALSAGEYVLASNRSGLRVPAYQRTDVRLNKAYVHQRLITTLYVEIVNVTNRTNRNFDGPGSYDPNTLSNTPTFFSMFPILPSVGISLAF